MVAPEKLANDYQSKVTLSCGEWMAQCRGEPLRVERILGREQPKDVGAVNLFRAFTKS